MNDQEDLDELVFLFEDDLSAIASEMRYSEFESLLNHSATLEQFAASLVRSAYVVVGEALTIRAIVFFLLKIDEEGCVDDRFNVPLRYLAKQAARGPDLGSGRRILMACRSHCPVPWHAANLWEPEGVGDVHPAMRLQKAVWRNKLELKPRASRIASIVEGEDLHATAQSLESKLESTLEDGKVSVQSLIHTHNDQLQQVASQFRRELAAQQQAFMDQLRGAREEIQKLRTALKHEKTRTRRLQELLRGEI
ncbi:MAG: hypothetical protein ACR2PZ_12900 [Pseudomonadales bacterium]